MNWSRFEIWYADLNPKFGTEAGKVRPVLIIQTDLLEKHPSTLICPITSKTQKGVSILRVNLDKGEGGLTMDSAIMIDQLRAIDNKRLVEYIGQLPKKYHHIVDDNIKIVLDL